MNVSPANRIVPLGSRRNAVPVQVEVVNNRSGGIEGQLSLELPEGWTAEPSEHDFQFSQANARRYFSFPVNVPRLREGTYDLQAVARAGS